MSTFDTTTSATPWMDIAVKQEKSGVHELHAKDAFLDQLRLCMVSARPLSVTPPPSHPGPRLGVGSLQDPTAKLIGQLDASNLATANPQIAKFFEGVKTDPAYGGKRARSFDVAPTYSTGSDGHITAWCAAFVNWCLQQAGMPHLGYATAKSWLQFGTPLASPSYGCVTIVKPSESTGSTTGHVAFFTKTIGAYVELLGGNQRGKGGPSRVCFSRCHRTLVLGYRWPRPFKDAGDFQSPRKTGRLA